MNGLEALKNYLEQIGTSGILQVFFDLNEVINSASTDKHYPYVFWDLNSLKFTEDTRQSVRDYSITVYAVVQHIREEESGSDAKIKAWDNLHTKFLAYLANLKTIENSYNFSIFNLNDVQGEYYDRGQVSVDEEIGIGYKLKLKGYC
jgi:hypothetical protein